MDILDNLDNLLFMLDYFVGCLEEQQVSNAGSPVMLEAWDASTCRQMAARIRLNLSSDIIRPTPKTTGKRTRIRVLAADLAIESIALKRLKGSLCDLAQEWIAAPGEPDWDPTTCRQAAIALFKLVAIKTEALYVHNGHTDWDLINPDDTLRRKALKGLVERTIKEVYRSESSN